MGKQKKKAPRKGSSYAKTTERLKAKNKPAKKKATMTKSMKKY